MRNNEKIMKHVQITLTPSRIKEDHCLGSKKTAGHPAGAPKMG